LPRLGGGWSANKEVGNELKISEGTVRIHLAHIYWKLHVHCRTEAATKYSQAQRTCAKVVAPAK